MHSDPIHYSIDEISSILKTLKSRKIFLVRGKKSFHRLDECFALNEKLKEYEVCHFSDFSTNPKFEDALRGIEAIKKFRADVILAIGGGSVLDMAKAIKAGASDLENFKMFFQTNEELQLGKCLPMIAVPSTAGTGAETTHFAVVYYENRKYSLAHNRLRPETIVLDHRLPHEAPFEIKCSAAIDALSQSIEGIWSKNCNDEAFSYGLKAFQLIYSNIEEAIVNNDPQAMKSLSLGAYYAGRTIDIAKTTAPHAFSYNFTSSFNIPHGQAVAITFPFFIRYNCLITANDTPSNSHEVAINRIHKTLSNCNILSITEFEEWLWDIYYKLKIRFPLKKSISSFADFDKKFVQTVNFERLGNNPRSIIPQDISRPLFHFITQEFSL